LSDVIVDALLFAGVLVLLLAAAGVLVMRNAYDRLHYSSAAGWGAALIAIAIVARESLSLIGDKALATAAVLLLCGPALAHATARAGRIRTRGAWNDPRGVEGSERDDGQTR
jgi:multisubunit Na+/H+ antiporter MnhG subunit